MLYHEDGSIKGIATNDVGIHKDGSPKVLNYFDLSFVFFHNTLLLVVWPFCLRVSVKMIILCFHKVVYMLNVIWCLLTKLKHFVYEECMGFH